MPEYKELGRQAAIAATVLTVSTGLCGLTAIASMKMQGGEGLAIPFGAIELIGMIIGAIWLVSVLLVLLGKYLLSLLPDPKAHR